MVMSPRFRGTIARPTDFENPSISVNCTVLGAVIKITEADKPENWLEMTVDHVVLLEWTAEMLGQAVMSVVDTSRAVDLLHAQRERF